MLDETALRLYEMGGHRTRTVIRKLVLRSEGGQFRSPTIRQIYAKYYGVTIGMFTEGGCFDLYTVDPHTTIGRYCSIARGVRIVNHNHPLNFKGTSALFFNPDLGYCDDWLVSFNPLTIGNDVWIGAHAVIMPEVNTIGDGAVIGAGAVVSRDVPPFAVVLGNPGRVVKYRFSEPVIEQLLAERWWDRDLEELGPDLPAFHVPLEPGREGQR